MKIPTAVLSAITNAVRADVLNQKQVIYNEDSEESCSWRFRRIARDEYLWRRWWTAKMFKLSKNHRWWRNWFIKAYHRMMKKLYVVSRIIVFSSQNNTKKIISRHFVLNIYRLKCDVKFFTTIFNSTLYKSLLMFTVSNFFEFLAYKFVIFDPK